ncbi:MAG: hypothetical protein ABI616_12110 [Pseudomonadota bacterium]
MIARPSVEEERWLIVAGRYPALRAVVEQLRQGGNWKTTTWLGRCLGFLLGLFGSSLLAGVLSQILLPLLIGGLLLMVAAEWLIAKRRVFNSGIEEAVYLCGAVAAVGQLLVWSNGLNDALAVALVSTAVLLVGWRLLNPLFTTLAAAGYSLAVALVGTHFLNGRIHTLEAGMACVALGVAALVAGGRQWLRPSHDRMVDGLVIAMPWLAYAWLTAYGWNGKSLPAWATLALATGFLMTNLILGVKRRQHAPLIGALGNLVCAAFSLHQLLHWPQHWELIAAGGVLLLLAILLERKLHGRIEGITSLQLNEPSGLDLMQLAGAASMAPSPGAPPAGMQGKGGDFGGGGASGRF